jgi:hypothetical protein
MKIPKKQHCPCTSMHRFDVGIFSPKRYECLSLASINRKKRDKAVQAPAASGLYEEVFEMPWLLAKKAT